MRKPLYILLALLGLVLGWFVVGPVQRSERQPVDERATVSDVQRESTALAPVPVAGREVREGLPVSETPGGEQPVQAPALLRVLVLERGGGAALAGIPVCLCVAHEGGVWKVPEEPSVRWNSADVLRTDAAGLVEFEVAPERPFLLLVNWEGGVEAGREQTELYPFAPGERRELTVELAAGLDGVWFGRIVDGTNGAPLGGARVGRVAETDAFHKPLGDLTEVSAPDGTVRLVFASWQENVARVELDGYAPGFITLGEGHAEANDALTVRLLRHALLDMQVRDARGRACADVDVRLSCIGFDLLQAHQWFSFGGADPRWEGRTDVGGRVELAELPAEVPLTLELRAGDRVLVHEERALLLEAGERRVVERIVGWGCTVTGRTLEADGRPAPGVRLWLLPGGDPRLVCQNEDKALLGVQREVQSDAQGTFTLADVAAGEWLVVPAPSSSRDSDSPDSVSIARAAVPFVIAADQTRATLDVPCWRGLSLEGTVVGPYGEPVEQAYVLAERPDFLAGQNLRNDTFSIGPLPAGRFRLVAYSQAGTFAKSEQVTALAGESGLVLRMQRGAELRVRVLDQTGGRVPGVMLWVLNEHDEEHSIGLFTDEVGEVTQAGMLPGTYTLSAADPSGALGVLHGVALTSLAEQPTIELRLEPAARLRLRIPDALAEGAVVRIRREGEIVAFAVLGESRLICVPPGELEVELAHWTYWTSPPEPLQVLRVTARLGEETPVEFEAP